ncbi:hypothetical protein MPRF_35670 [Mycolicibacterium parafortuitum]|uniref:Uncharacterized protein n=1 Tax=Mycolicibacterium parafortuitum TaxID=39692 RepID=A0A7I7U5N3_MYCPF|nr:hypothetical protein [Mycolicibacterium parafortuitum]BBY76668.1 hypothetical protein MPRF_35670 [Mycolicibacterium parafortuitum]
MSGSHAELGPELRALAQSILDKLDPAIRLAAARAQAAGGGPGPCQQVWCPVCALAALISGEQHPLLTVVAEHSVALLTLLKAMVEDMEAAPAAAESPHPPDPSPDDPGPPDPAPPDPPGRYQHIPVSIDE